MISPQQLTRDRGGFWRAGQGNAACPCCQPERRVDQNALSLGEKDGRLLLFCHKSGCTFSDILRAAGVQPGSYEVDFDALQQARRERLEAEAKAHAKARSIWDRGAPIDGTHGEKYLRSRGITCDLPESLRWVADLYHGPSGRWSSAMVGNVTNATGNPMGLHRTYLSKQGERLPTSAKLMLAKCQGGAVRLSDTRGPLVVSEGIEDGLSLLSGVLNGPASVWAALSTSGMVGLSLPADAGKLIVAHDADEPGKAAAFKLAERANGSGWQVSFLPPPAGFKDWAEVAELEGAT